MVADINGLHNKDKVSNETWLEEKLGESLPVSPDERLVQHDPET